MSEIKLAIRDHLHSTHDIFFYCHDVVCLPFEFLRNTWYILSLEGDNNIIDYGVA